MALLKAFSADISCQLMMQLGRVIQRVEIISNRGKS